MYGLRNKFSRSETSNLWTLSALVLYGEGELLLISGQRYFTVVWQNS